MKLIKDGNSIELDNPIQVDAFISSGYIEVKEQETPAPKPEKKTTRKKKD